MSLVLSFNLTDSIPFHFQPSLFDKQNYFAQPIDVPLVGSEKSGEIKKKK